MKLSLNYPSAQSITVLILFQSLGLFLAQTLIPAPADLVSISRWFEMGVERGFLGIYGQWTQREAFLQFHDFGINYPPLILWLAPLYKLLYSSSPPAWPSWEVGLFFRMPILLGHGLVYFYAYHLLSKQWGANQKRQFLYWIGFNPVFILIGLFWGQWDVILVGAFYFCIIHFERNQMWRSALFAVLALMLKPQFLLLLPILGLGLLRNPSRLKWVLYFCLFVLIFNLPFILADGFNFLIVGYAKAFQTEAQLSPSAHNFWWIIARAFSITFSNQLIGVFPAKLIGTLITASIGLLLGGFYLLQPKRWPLNQVALTFFLAAYFFLTGMASRNLVFGLTFLCILSIEKPSLRLPAFFICTAQIFALLNNILFSPYSRYYGLFTEYFATLISLGSATIGLMCVFWIFNEFVWQPSKAAQ